MTAKLFKPDGTMTPVEPQNGKDFQLDELNRFVDGYIEIVRPLDMPGYIMVINEEGKLKGLPFNPMASKFWHANDPIVGNALLCRTEQVK